MPYDKALFKKEQIARYTLAGLTDAEIAERLSMTHAGVVTAKQQPEYKAIETSLRDGVLTQMDAELGEDIVAMRTKLRTYVPAALQTLIDAAQQRKDLKLAVNASEALIAMDGRMAKVSRTGVATPEQGGSAISQHDNDAAQELLNALKSPVTPTPENIPEPPQSEPNNTSP